jgi:hypothetical protein
MKAIPFSRRPKTGRGDQEQDIDLVRARDQHHKVRWNREVTRQLGVYLDHSLTFAVHQLKVVSKAKSAEGHLRSLINKFGIP